MKIVVGLALPLDGVEGLVRLLQNCLTIRAAIIKQHNTYAAADAEFFIFDHQGLPGGINNFFRDLSNLQARGLFLGAEVFQQHDKFIAAETGNGFLGADHLAQTLSE